MERSVHARVCAKTELHVQGRGVRWEESNRLDRVGIAPGIIVLSAVLLREPVADSERPVGKISCFPHSVAMWVSSERLFGIRGISHWEKDITSILVEEFAYLTYIGKPSRRGCSYEYLFQVGQHCRENSLVEVHQGQSSQASSTKKLANAIDKATAILCNSDVIA